MQSGHGDALFWPHSEIAGQCHRDQFVVAATTDRDILAAFCCLQTAEPWSRSAHTPSLQVVRAFHLTPARQNRHTRLGSHSTLDRGSPRRPRTDARTLDRWPGPPSSEIRLFL